MARGRLHKRYTKKKRRNPDSPSGGGGHRPSLTEIGEDLIPGVAGFVTSRFITRIAAVQVAKRAPNLGRHAGAAAAVGTLVAAWLLLHRWKAAAKYQNPILIGAAIATIQSLLQLYVPRLGWIVSDASTELDGVAAGNQPMMDGSVQGAPLPRGLRPVDDDPDLYVYDDRYSAAPPQRQRAAPPQSAPVGPASSSASTEDQLLAELDADAQQTSGLGIFAPGN